MRLAAGLLTRVLAVSVTFHFWGSLAIVLLAAAILSAQLADRGTFANSELREDVTRRWGAPIDQPSPSLRYVASGSVFTTLESLPFNRQHVVVDAAMNYRKRGLVYFSGFEFAFNGVFGLRNDRPYDIDIVPTRVGVNRRDRRTGRGRHQSSPRAWG